MSRKRENSHKRLKYSEMYKMGGGNRLIKFFQITMLITQFGCRGKSGFGISLPLPLFITLSHFLLPLSLTHSVSHKIRSKESLFFQQSRCTLYSSPVTFRLLFPLAGCFVCSNFRNKHKG